MLKIEVLVVSPFMENCYLLSCEKTKEAILVDAGDEAWHIIQRVEELGVKVKMLVNTHAHVDHISAVAALQEKWNLPFLLHEAEQPILGGLLASQRAYGFGDGKIPQITEFLKPNQTYTFGEVEFSVLETPGHTPGGVCLYFGDNLFVGDTLFWGSIGRTDLPGGNYEQLIDSIKSKLLTLDDSVKVHSGHGGPTTIGQERLSNPFLI